MNPDGASNRIYSTARMKRRASKQTNPTIDVPKPEENQVNVRSTEQSETRKGEAPPEMKRADYRTGEGRTTDRTEESRTRNRTEQGRTRDRTEESRTRNRTEEGRTRDRTEESRTRNRTEEGRTRDRTGESRTRDRTEEGRKRDGTEESRTRDRTGESRIRDRTEEGRTRNRTEEDRTRDRTEEDRTRDRLKEDTYAVKKHTQFQQDSENISPEKERSERTKRVSLGEILKHPLQEKHLLEKNVRSAEATPGKSDTSFESTDSSPYGISSPVEEVSSFCDSMRGREKFMILCSLLPDEILRDPINSASRFYQCALMFPDVSGFTQLCQKYDKTGMGGPSRLTTVLNGYIGSMIKIVLSRHGDVCKFGGDAFLCSWKVTEDMSLTEVVHLAIESAIDIQKNCGEHKTDVGVKLRVKIAVSAGDAIFSIIGTKSKKHYVIVGPPVLEVRDAEQLCRPGDVIVTPSAWNHVTNYMFYSFTYHSDNIHIKVHDFGPLWKSAKPDTKTRGRTSASGTVRPFLKTHLSIRTEDVQPFILPPVMKSIDLDRSLDHLTEMRQVAIVFFNITLNFNDLPVEEVVHLSNQAFQVISAKVDKAGGGTNKLTLFDKDMAILTVFGLKGFKHELASQVALKCAYSCIEQLKRLHVNTASAGVTTGMAYCGVIGHPQRKEYTVMGHPVNMAARLMCAYQNIVSCDRSTFLNSKLESGHFELLEVEYLKGIQNAGPFYKFNINPERVKLKMDHEGQPILGRGKEVQQFEVFLSRGSSPDSAVNFFIISGTARIGKSRLAAKFVNVAQTHVLKRNVRRGDIDRQREIQIIPLTENDYKVSYSTVRLIFQPLLGLSESPSVQEREDKILSALKEFQELNMLASFNQIFNVNFDMSPQYLALGEKEHATARMTWLIKLYNRCFPKGEKWLIVIEDAEFVDEESWHFLTWCSLESQKALYLLTIGQKKALSHSALNCLDRIKAKRITLTEIEKWFYLGLACQILGVQAIPVELESLLQTYKSSGNPGWLESFLLSLIQSGGVYIGQVSSAKIKSMGLVSPPEFMLSNRAAEIKSRDDSYWVDCVETFESNPEDKKNIRVCLLGSNFPTGGENVGDLTMDVMFIKTMDGLTPLEQLVLKAGSVLGNNIKRAALKYVISKDMPVEDRLLAKATKKLFEMKVLICGRGDLTQKNQLISRRILDSSIRNEVVCECIGVKIPDVCEDLPKYANCGYMQFRFPSFRETVYNLLLDDQKKNFHNGCIEFLRENTYKCKSCKNVKFINVFGIREDDQVTLACTTTPMHGVRSTALEPTFNIPVRSRLYFSSRHRESRFPSDLVSNETEQGAISVPNLGDCQCSQILASLYSVLLEHAAGSGRKDLMLEIQLESASVNLFMYNIPLTMQILEQALSLVNELKENKEYPEYCTPYIYSKIYTLMGATKLSMGRLDESLELLKTGLKYMKHSFPRNRFWVRLIIIKRILMLKLAILFPEKFIGKTPNNIAHTTDLLSECLGLISAVYVYMQNGLFAENAALWSLSKALESNRNLFVLCSAYRNIIEVSYYRKDLNTCAELEIYANDVCKRCSSKKIELYEWEAIGNLYKVIFQTRHVRAEIEAAVHIGFQSLNIASLIHNTNLKLDLIPDLIFALIQLQRLSEAVTLLQELEFISRLDSDKSSRLWYYAMCLDFQLYTGFTIVPFEICENFVKSEEDLALVRDPFAKHRLYTSLWLWCVRNHEWELIKSYGNILKGSNVFKDKETPCTVFTRLQRLEGLLISVVQKMDARNIQSTNFILAEVNVIMNRLKKDVKIVKVFKPRFSLRLQSWAPPCWKLKIVKYNSRFLLMKTYYRQIRYRDDSYPRLLNQALVQAEKMKDKNTSYWITHLKLLWSNAVSPIDRDHWSEHSRKNIIEWNDSDEISQKPTIMYSLPLPKF